MQGEPLSRSVDTAYIPCKCFEYLDYVSGCKGAILKTATMYDVARVAGVSTATVSRVVRGSALVNTDTRDRVSAVISALGYVPDGYAQGLSNRRKDVIGLVGLERGIAETGVERTSLLFIDQVVHAAESVLRGTSFSLMLTFGSRGGEFEGRVRSLTGKVDGLLVVEHVMAAGELRVLAGRIPVVVIAGRREEAGLDVFTADNRAGMTALVRHLVVDHRYRRLSFVAGPRDAPDARERLAAFEAAVLAGRDSTVDQVICGDFSEGSGTAAARVLLDRAGRRSVPDAVVCANDQMAIGVLREFQRAGLRIPGDVAVTGFDDIYPAGLVDPPLTTVSQPIRELGARAAGRLLARIAEPGLPPRAQVLGTTVFFRASCGCRPGQNAGQQARGG
jgi:LacI family transcriptional regulator